MSDNVNFKAYLAWGAVCIFWGTTYLAIRIGVEEMPPMLFGGIRFFIAGLALTSFLRLRGTPFPPRQDLLKIGLVGFSLLTVANGAVVWSEQWVSSSLAALIVATLPFFMVGYEAMLPQGARITTPKVLGILIGFAGLFLLLWPEIAPMNNSALLKGILVIMIAPISWGAGSIYSKYRPARTTPLMSAALQMLIAGTILSLFGLAIGEASRLTLHSRGLLAMGYLIIFGSLIGYTAFIYALAHLPAAFVSTYAYINPVIAVLLGWLILGERLDWLVGISTVAILTGVVLVKSAAPAQKSKPIEDQIQEPPTARLVETASAAANLK